MEKGFLEQKYTDLHNSPEVKSAVKRQERRTGKKIANNPETKMDVYLNRLEEIFNHPDEETRKRRIEIYKEKILYPAVLIDKDNVPDSYFEGQLRIARERGYVGDLGDVNDAAHINIKTKQKEGQRLYEDQKKSLDVWVEYLTSGEAIYPSWFKYYCIRNVVKMGSYDKGKKEFEKRSKSTTNIFPDLNREALSFVFDVLEQHYLKHENHDNKELTRIVDSANFSRIYAYAIDKVTPASKENKEKTEGEWVRFRQGDDPTALYESLQGHGTGWCTAGEETAKKQLESGDFYVYYSEDLDNRNTIPRVAIRMKNGKVTEVRGINANQNLEGDMIEIAREKYLELPGGDKFEKKDYDMKRLTQIDNKHKDAQELTKEDLLFLYEIDSKIEGFGLSKDPRVEELLKGRDIRSDLALVAGCSKDQISLTGDEALRGDIKFHFGSLWLWHESAEGLILPERVSGVLHLGGLQSAEGLILPERVGGLDLRGLQSAEGLKLPDSVGGDLDLRGLQSAEGLELPDSVGGDLNLSGLQSAEGLKLPESLGRGLYLWNLQSAEGLELPKSVYGSLYLPRLLSAKGLKLPEMVDDVLNLASLQSAEGLILPERVSGVLHLGGLQSAEGLILPERVGDLDLRGLQSAEGLELPDSVGGNLDLNGLQSAEGLELPDSVGGDLKLWNLQSAEGLKLPDSVGGDLDLRGLQSAEGLELPKRVGGHIDLSEIQASKKYLLRSKYRNIKAFLKSLMKS